MLGNTWREVGLSLSEFPDKWREACQQLQQALMKGGAGGTWARTATLLRGVRRFCREAWRCAGMLGQQERTRWSAALSPWDWLLGSPADVKAGRTQPWCLAWGDPHRSRTKRQGSVRTAELSETPTCILLPPQVHKCTRRFGRFLSPLCTSGCAPPGSGMRDDQDGDCPGHCVNTLPPGENEQYAGSETVRLSRERVCQGLRRETGRVCKGHKLSVMR